MELDLFDFDLPEEAIAQRPVSPRDRARMLVVTDRLDDALVRDLPDHLRAGDVLVCNDTRVIPARLVGRRDGVRIEATLIRALRPGCWRALVRPGRRLRPGQRIAFAPDFSARVLEREPSGSVLLAFDGTEDDLLAALERFGTMPLPPYIRRPPEGDDGDREAYQTIFAARPGAVAAPTAGLHFTPELLARLRARGVRQVTVTLHVGAGTFLPVKSERVEDHVMHGEWGEVADKAALAVNRARDEGGRVVAVGTTSLRLLETALADDGRIRPFRGETDLFLIPGRRIRSAHVLLTNFHLPRSTLFMLVCAFSGTLRMKAAYAHAIASGYRFYSYGDCCLLTRAEGE